MTRHGGLLRLMGALMTGALVLMGLTGPASASDAPAAEPFAWGSNALGQLGNGTFQNSSVPVGTDTSGVLAGKKLVAFSSGFSHSCVLDSDGDAYCWGSNSRGELGTGDTAGAGVPVAVQKQGVLDGKRLVAIAAGEEFTCALDADGAAYCWGRNMYGQLGNSTNAGFETANPLPLAVDTSGALAGKTLTAVTAGAGHACVLDSDGKAFCWGRNTWGQVGSFANLNSSDPNPSPHALGLIGFLQDKTLKTLAAGGTQTCTIDTDGRAYCWGRNDYGQLGNPSAGRGANPSAFPVSYPADRNLISLATGEQHTCAVDAEGLAYCWGWNLVGQLGSNVNISSFSANALPLPVDVSGVLADKSLTTIAAGTASTCAIDDNGAAFCWGLNASGELGTTTGDTSPSPVAVDTSDALNRKRMTAISVGHGFAGGLAADVHRLTYDANGGTGTPPIATAEMEASTLIASDGAWASRSGYTLKAWNTAADGTGTPVALGAQFTMPSQNTTLYAQWSGAPAPAPSPTATPANKKAQRPASGKGKPPAKIKQSGLTVITGKNARTDAGQMIRTQVRCAQTRAGKDPLCTVIRGPKGKVSLRTYGQRVRVVVVQSARGTTDYKPYRLRTVYRVRG